LPNFERRWMIKGRDNTSTLFQNIHEALLYNAATITSYIYIMFLVSLNITLHCGNIL